MKSRFTHDCTNAGCCKFVGITNHHDVYVSRSGTLIMRYGDDGPDYLSMPMSMARQVATDHPEYFHAVQLVDHYEQDQERSWSASPDRSGGQFSAEEIADFYQRW